MSNFDWSLPYPSQREAVLAKNVVATSQPLAAQAGLRMLRAGGNAADAAVAAATTLTVVEPTSNGIGGDNFALVWAGGGLHGLNASGLSPRQLDPTRYKDMDSVPLYGWDAVTTPGAPSGWVALHERFGSLPFEQVLEPAIEYARNGFLVSRQTALYWAAGCRRYSDFESYQKTFCPNGRAPKPGEQFKSEDHASTLEQIAATKGEAFYHGELAEKIDQYARETGGALRADDLAQHEPDWVRPISLDYRGYTLNEIPPNGQGLAALIMLGIVEHFDLDAMPVDSVQSLHVQIEAMKLAMADAHRYIADPRFMDVSVESLLDPAYLNERAKQIDPAKAGDFNHGKPKDGGTVYLTTADAEGMMVSFIQSNYTGFGSGMVVPGTGIALQNRGGCFTTEQGHPNQIAPGKRPYHTIIPGFVTRENERGRHEPIMSFGVMGGYMQPQGHAQVVIRMNDYNQNPQAALDAPRWQVDEGRTVLIEPGFDESVYDALREIGHDLRPADSRTVRFGRGQVACRLENGYFGASDLRADGQAVGF